MTAVPVSAGEASLLLRLYRDHAAAAAGGELHDAGARREDRVVLADADAVARPEAGTALANDDLAAAHCLPGEHLHAEALGVRVAAVAAGAESLLVSHLSSPSWPCAWQPASWPPASWRGASRAPAPFSRGAWR